MQAAKRLSGKPHLKLHKERAFLEALRVYGGVSGNLIICARTSPGNFPAMHVAVFTLGLVRDNVLCRRPTLSSSG